MQPKFLERRASFNQVPELYATARPGYPKELIDAVCARLPERAHLLEVGCGPGQATAAFLERGCSILALELGDELAAYARTRFADVPEVEIRNQDFHSFEPDEATFDGLIAGSSWHWLMPEVAYPIAAKALKPGGVLALFWNKGIRNPAMAAFEDALQVIYDEEIPEWKGSARPVNVIDLEDERTEQIESTGLFTEAEMLRYPWFSTVTAEQHIATLQTYSDHIILSAKTKERVYGRIKDLIDSQPGGVITKAYVSVLYLAKRVVS